MSVPTNIEKALIACKSCPHMPQLSLACESNPCPSPSVIGYVADAPEDECSTCICSDHCAMTGERECEYSLDA